MRYTHFCLGLSLLVLSAFATRLAAETLEIENDIFRVETLTDTTAIVTGRSELHLTGNVSDPFPGSEIHLNSEDAWLILSRIRPSAVGSGILSRIFVNGNPASADQNVRVVQYAEGSVILPHGSGFAPLTLFREPHFEGGFTQIPSNAYFNTSTNGLNFGRFNWNDSISSFILRRGYMATFAENMDGTGASRVYVAQDGDLEIGMLPEELDNKIRFLRVVPWRWVSKKGYAGGSEEPGAEPDRVNAAWFYNWNNNRNSSLDMEYVPIQQTAVWPGYDGTANKSNVTHYMGYNEPDSPDQDASQFTPTPQSAINQWPGMMRAGFRLGSPSMTDGGLNWLYQFMDLADADDQRVDYVVVHYYRGGQNANQFYTYLREIYEQTGRPLWVKEFNNGANWTCCLPSFEENAVRIGEFIDMMDNTPWVERYSIYSWVETQRQVFVNGNFTPMGEVYRDQESPIGFLQDFPGGVGHDAHYTFNGNVRDSGDHGNHAMGIGSPKFEPGVSGDSIRFDGDLDYVQLPENVGKGHDFTFAAWVKWDGGGNWQRIFDFGDAHNQYLFLTPRSGPGTLRFTIRQGGTQQELNADPLDPGEWAHVAVTIGRGGTRLYVNGESVDAAAANLRPADLRTRYHYLGRSQAQYPDPFFAGLMDDVRILDRALSPAEIAELATLPEPAQTYGAWADDIDFPPGLADLQDDPDRDGIPNGLEYLLGSDPLVPSSGRLPEGEFIPGADLGTEADADKTYLTLRIRVLKGAAGVRLTPRAGASIEDLASPDAADTIREVVPPEDDGEFEIRTFYYTVPLEDSPTGRAFMRLHVTSD